PVAVAPLMFLTSLLLLALLAICSCSLPFRASWRCPKQRDSSASSAMWPLLRSLLFVVAFAATALAAEPGRSSEPQEPDGPPVGLGADAGGPGGSEARGEKEGALNSAEGKLNALGPDEDVATFDAATFAEKEGDPNARDDHIKLVLDGGRGGFQLTAKFDAHAHARCDAGRRGGHNAPLAISFSSGWSKLLNGRACVFFAFLSVAVLLSFMCFLCKWHFVKDTQLLLNARRFLRVFWRMRHGTRPRSPEDPEAGRVAVAVEVMSADGDAVKPRKSKR
ncbi:uncharacterized protein Tco025E_05340, partial [Trypanosoma conorhini]